MRAGFTTSESAPDQYIKRFISVDLERGRVEIGDRYRRPVFRAIWSLDESSGTSDEAYAAPSISLLNRSVSFEGMAPILTSESDEVVNFTLNRDKYCIRAERDSVTLIMSSGAQVVRYVRNLQAKFLAIDPLHTLPTNEYPLATSYICPPLRDGNFDSRGITLGGPINVMVPVHYSESRRLDGRRMEWSRCNATQARALAAAAILYRSLTLPHDLYSSDAGYLPQTSIGLADGAVISAVMGSLFEIGSRYAADM